MHKQQLLLLAGCFVLLVLLWGGKMLWPTAQPAFVTQYVIEEIDRIVLTVGEATMEVRKADNEWKLTTPIEAPDQEGVVEEMLTQLHHIEGQGEISNTLEQRAQYGLDAANEKRMQGFAGDTKMVDIALGKTAPRGLQTYGYSNGTAPILLLKGNLSRFIPASPQALRNKTLHDVTGKTITQVAVANSTGKVTIIKDTQGQWITAPEVPANEEAVTGLLNQFQVFQAQTIIDTPTLIPTADNATGTLYLTTADGDVYHYFMLEDNGQYLGATADQSQVFTMAQYLYDRVTADVAGFEGR